MIYDAEVAKAVSHWAQYFGVRIDPALIHGIIERESRHGQDPNYIRNGGVIPEPDGDYSYGPMMVKGDTARTVLHVEPTLMSEDPAIGIWYGVKYFGSLLKKFGGDVERAVAGYNAGPGNATRPFPNPAYVAAVKGFWKKYGGSTGSAAGIVFLGILLWFLMSRRRVA